MAGFFDRLYSKKKNVSVKRENIPVSEPMTKREEPQISFPDYSTSFEKVNDAIANSKKETLDAIHQENVKVYRNVQAVVVEETSKVSKGVLFLKDSVDKKVNVAIVFAILAFALSLINLVFDVLCKFNII